MSALDWGTGENLAFQLRHRTTGNSILHIAADGWGWVWIKELRKLSPFDEDHAVRELLERLNSISGLEVADKGISKFEIGPVSAPETIRQILDVVAWVIEQLHRTQAIPRVTRKLLDSRR